MTVEPIAQRAGPSKARVICDDCGADEVVACGYHRDSPNKPTSPNKAQARAKAMAGGWTYVKNVLRCPDCEAKRKVVPMKAKTDARTKPTEPTEPTKAQKRDIMAALEACYDTDAERYMAGETDQSVADMCKVQPGFVAKLRDEFFGPDGGNENIADLVERLDDMAKSLQAILDSAAQQHEAATKKMAEVATMRADLEKIRKAVGPAARARAGA